MAEASVYAIVASIAAILGGMAGRVFAEEGENLRTSVLAAVYVSAGVGLISSLLTGTLLSLAVQLLTSGSSTWFDALDVASMALVWGTAAGAAGGLASGIIVAMISLVRPKRS